LGQTNKFVLDLCNFALVRVRGNRSGYKSGGVAGLGHQLNSQATSNQVNISSPQPSESREIDTYKMVCKGCGTSKWYNAAASCIIDNRSRFLDRLPVLGPKVRGQLRLQQGLPVRLQEWAQGPVLQQQISGPTI